MDDLIFIKLGGSLITDKHKEATYRSPIVKSIGGCLRAILNEYPKLQLLLAHGSGSFGHKVAARHGTRFGVKSKKDWFGFIQVARAASELNQLVRKDLIECQIPVISIQPSSSLLNERGKIISTHWLTLRETITQNLIPLLYGDVAFDLQLGGSIASTEEILSYLVQPLQPNRILLLGDSDGVLDENGKIIESITPTNFTQLEPQILGSNATDVTGGMWNKVVKMLDVVRKHQNLTARIMSGYDHPSLRAAILGNQTDLSGTLIQAD